MLEGDRKRTAGTSVGGNIERLTIADIARETLAGEPGGLSGKKAFGYALRNFLDDFYATPSEARSALLGEEPVELRAALSDGGVADAYLAALANHLAGLYGLPRPEWSRASSWRYPDKPWFALKTPEARIWLLTQSPAAFRERDLFISEDALSRA